MSAPVEKLAYSVKDLYEMLPIGQKAVQRLARQLGVRVGGRLIVSRTRLDAWLASGESLPVVRAVGER